MFRSLRLSIVLTAAAMALVAITAPAAGAYEIDVHPIWAGAGATGMDRPDGAGHISVVFDYSFTGGARGGEVAYVLPLLHTYYHGKQNVVSGGWVKYQRHKDGFLVIVSDGRLSFPTQHFNVPRGMYARVSALVYYPQRGVFAEHWIKPYLHAFAAKAQLVSGQPIDWFHWR